MLSGLLHWRSPTLKVFCAGSLMLSVVMLTGLLQQKNSSFEGVTRRKFAAIGYRFPLSPVSSSETNRWRKNKLFERLKIRKSPTKFQGVCLKTFCAVRATLQLEDFNVEGLTRRQFAARKGFHYDWFSFPNSQVMQFMTPVRNTARCHHRAHSRQRSQLRLLAGALQGTAERKTHTWFEHVWNV